MKRILGILLTVAIVACAFPSFGCNVNRDEVLKVYNAGEYMDEDVIDGFSDWYEEKTGKKVTISYKTYSTNEDMYTEIYKKKADYDVVCGSDYIISRLLRNDLLLPVDRALVYGEAGEASTLSPRILGFVNDYENWNGAADYTDGVRYSVPYMWGTFGIMYRNDLVSKNGAPAFDWKNLSWDVLFKKGDFSGKRYMKNSIRDAFASASIVSAADELRALSNGFTDYNEAYRKRLSEVINDVSADNLKKVESVLKEQKKYLFAYESDDGKDDMITTAPSGWYGLFWSCDAGYAMEDSTDLYYGVPVEGANVWVDSFCIPKYTKNEQAAQYFLQYLCEYEQAYVNRDYAGCSSPIEAVAADTKQVMQTALEVAQGKKPTVSEDIAEDVAYYAEFFSGASGEDFGEMFIELLFPSEEVLSRCAVMKDSDKDACIEMAKMWIRTKAS